MLTRRDLLRSAALGASALAVPAFAGAGVRPRGRIYHGPNVVLVRFGGGVRRRESIDPAHTYAPFLAHELIPRGTLFPQMEISAANGIDTSHGQGTLNLLTGRYAAYRDVNDRFLGDRFEAEHPTLFEQLRRAYRVGADETLIVNGEDRTDEEFYAFSNHADFGPEYRCNILSLYRFKCFLLRRQLREDAMSEAERATKELELVQLEALDLRDQNRDGQGAAIEAFWERWRAHYGESGRVNPRGDRLLTELSLRALRELRPRLLMINYNDPDYVHWGNPSHYTRGIAIIDEGVNRLVGAVQADPFYRDNTIFVIAPDCGRDSNRFMSVPYQHHFNSRSSREVFALFFGAGVPRGRVVDRVVPQVAVAPTVAAAMGFAAPHAEWPALSEAIA